MLSGNDKISNGMGLDNLLSEPQRLSAESDRLNSELESLVLDNYKIFVDNLTCSVHLRAEDKKLSDISVELRGSIEELTSRCSTFKDRVNQFVAAHKRNRKTLQHHMQLVELLEVPQLVDACARNGFHDEALELANFVNGLERRHLLVSEVKSVDGKRSGSGVVQSIVDDVHHTMTGLRQQLLQSLTEMSSLPKEIQILSTLRKLDRMLIDRHLALERHELECIHGEGSTSDAQREQLKQQFIERSELRLQMDFLEARSIWLLRSTERKLVGSSSSSSASSAFNSGGDDSSDGIAAATPGIAAGASTLGPYGKIIELLEVRRTAWFAIISQFNSLFLIHNATSGSNSATSASSGPGVDTSLAILNAWTSSQVHQLLSDLTSLLPLLEEGGSLRSVLEQSLFFANRMGQVGCDFSELILPLFRDVIVDRVSKELKEARENFKTIVLKERISLESATSDGKREPQLIPLFAQQDVSSISGSADVSLSSSAGIGSTSGPGHSENELEIPPTLMKFPPLAYLLNCILSCLNFVRECPLLTVRAPVLQALEGLFGDLAAYLVEKAVDVRTLGSKYVNDVLSSVKKGTKSRLGAGAATTAALGEEGEIEKNMDVLYAQALAFDLFPHVLLCFESIYSTQPVKIVERVKNYKLKYTGGASAAAKAAADAKSTSHAAFLMNSSTQCTELLGKQLAQVLVEGSWTVLVSGGILKLVTKDKE